MQLSVLRKNIGVAQHYLDLRPGALQSRHHQRARCHSGATSIGAIPVASGAVDRPDRCGQGCDRRSRRRIPRDLGQGAGAAGRDSAATRCAFSPACPSNSCAGGPTSRRPSANWRVRHRADRRRHREPVSSGSDYGGGRLPVARARHQAGHHQSDLVGRAGGLLAAAGFRHGSMPWSRRPTFAPASFFFAYKQTVLGAVRDVDIAVSAYAAQQDRLRYLGNALVAAQARRQPRRATIRSRT